MKKQQSNGMELIVSSVLQAGVVVSSVIILVSMILFFTHGNQNGSYHQFTTTTYSFPHSTSALKTAIKAGEGTGFIELGVLLLILTPILRVAISVLLFLRQHDMPMTIVTVLVLLILVGSFYVGVIVK